MADDQKTEHNHSVIEEDLIPKDTQYTVNYLWLDFEDLFEYIHKAELF